MQLPLGYVPGLQRSWYSRVSHRVFGSRQFSRAIEYRIVRRWVPQGRNGSALDLAAGSCLWSVALALSGYRVTALDLEPGGLRYAADASVENVFPLAADAAELPLRDEIFDLVLCNSALEHFPDPGSAIREMGRVLRPGGRLVLTVDSFPERWSPLLRYIPRTWRKPALREADDLASLRRYHQRECRVVTYFDRHSLEQGLQAAGLDVVEVCDYLNRGVAKLIFEMHLLLSPLGFYNALSRRLFPLFWPFTFWRERPGRGWGLAVLARKRP